MESQFETNKGVERMLVSIVAVEPWTARRGVVGTPIDGHGAPVGKMKVVWLDAQGLPGSRTGDAAESAELAAMARRGDVVELEFKGGLLAGALLELWDGGELKGVVSACSLSKSGRWDERTEGVPQSIMDGLGLPGWPEEAADGAGPSMEQWSVAAAAVSKAAGVLNQNQDFLTGGALLENTDAMEALSTFGNDLSLMDDQSVELAAGMLRRCVAGSGGELGQEKWRGIHSAVAARVRGPARARLHEGMLGTRMPWGGPKI